MSADPINFHKNHKVGIQDLGWCPNGKYQSLDDDFASAAFWYQKKPHALFPNLPLLKDRWELTLFPISLIHLNFLEAREGFIPCLTVLGRVGHTISACQHGRLACLDVGQMTGGNCLNHRVAQR